MTHPTSDDKRPTATWWDAQNDQRQATINAALNTTRGRHCLGNPGQDSPVLATANYKLSFDALRKELTGIDAWLLVADLTCARRHHLLIFDLADCTWRDAYDGGIQPAAALHDALNNDDTIGLGEDALP